MNDFLRSRVIQEDMQNIYSRDIPTEELYGKSVLVTGATGMLASYLVYYLIWLNEKQSADIHIIALARNEKKVEERFGIYRDRDYFETILSDVCDIPNIKRPVDYIVHAASLASPQYYTKIPVEVASANVIGTYNMLNLAVEKKVKGFLYFSSGDIYGRMPDDAGIFSENQMGIMDPMDIHSCYGESKRMGETFCKCFYEEYGVRACAVRIGHTYAPTMDIENDPRVFASFMKCAVNRRDIVMLSDGSAKRPFCYIADAVAAFIILLIRGEGGEAYNMTNTDMFVSVLELAEAIATLEPDAHLKVIRKQRDRNDNYLENDLNHANCPGSEKLKRLGWKCEYDVRRGFSQVLAYYREKEQING